MPSHMLIKKYGSRMLAQCLAKRRQDTIEAHTNNTKDQLINDKRFTTVEQTGATRAEQAKRTTPNDLEDDTERSTQAVATGFPPDTTEAKITYLGQLTTFKDAVQVEFEHHIECAWATFTSYRQELTSPKYPLRNRLKLFNATVTPSLLCASGTWTMTAEMKKKLQTTQRRMMRLIMQTKRHTGINCAVAHAASVTADVEPHDPDSEQGSDATEFSSANTTATTQTGIQKTS